VRADVAVAPGAVLGRREFAERLGLTEGRVRDWLTRGVLSQFPRIAGQYTRADLAVARLVLELQKALGTGSEHVDRYARQIAPRVWNAVRDGKTQPLHIRLTTDEGLVIEFKFVVNADGSITATC